MLCGVSLPLSDNDWLLLLSVFPIYIYIPSYVIDEDTWFSG